MIKLAAPKFPGLTRAERALLEFADVDNLSRGELAICGPSATPLDASNDPAHADRWSHDRDIRAALIRWLAVDHGAVDPDGVRLLGARIVGPLNLSHVRVPFPIAMVRCSFPERISLDSTEIPMLDLSGSYSEEIYAQGVSVRGDLVIGSLHRGSGGFHASGLVLLSGARVGGDLSCDGADFRSSKAAEIPMLPSKTALAIDGADIKGSVYLCCRFNSHGAVFLADTTIGRNLYCFEGHFFNPNDVALDAGHATIGGNVMLQWWPSPDPNETFEADGVVNFVDAHVGRSFLADRARFMGKAGEQHGLNASAISVKSAFFWKNVSLANGATLDLSGADVTWFSDDERSWPAPGKLFIGDFKYHGIGGGSPVDVPSRLRWIALNDNPNNPGPYDQLAKFYSQVGAKALAARVLVERDDALYKNADLIPRIWGRFLKVTIGYGHEPLLTVIWSLMVVLLGWALVTIGQRAGVMRPTWPESFPAMVEPTNEKLHPLLYSLDVFLPFVNLHQEHYWWPDAERSGTCGLFTTKLRVSGSFLRHYLWLQIIAGWMLSAIFIAGVTGLIRTFE